MAKIALDPTPFHHDLVAPRVPAKVARRSATSTCSSPRTATSSRSSGTRRPTTTWSTRSPRRCRTPGCRWRRVLPVLRWSGPDEDAREAAVQAVEARHRDHRSASAWTPINTEFCGRPERAEESEAQFYRSMEELLPIIEDAGMRVLIDPHPDDFVEDGLEALPGDPRPELDSTSGFVYVGLPHVPLRRRHGTPIIDAAGDSAAARSTSPTPSTTAARTACATSRTRPATPSRVHQHLPIGDGDVDFDAVLGGARPASASSAARTPSRCRASSPRTRTPTQVSRFQLDTITKGLHR